MKKILFYFVLILSVIILGSITAFAVNEKGLGRWNTPRNISVYIQDHKYKGLMQQAFKTWSKATHNRFRFVFVQSQKNADITCNFTETFVEEDELTIPGELGLTKLKVAMDASATKQTPKKIIIVHADITIAEKHPQNQKDLTEDEVYTTMLHEIGHALGLAHAPQSERNSIMYPNCNTQVCDKGDITQFDLKQLYDLYRW